MTHEWDDASDEERAEAEALARALEGEGASPLLDVAALLSHAQEGELDEARLVRGIESVLAKERNAPAKVRPLRPLLYGSAILAAAAAAILWVRPWDVGLPAPSAGFVRAQAHAAAGGGGAELDAATADHRRRLYTRLGSP